MCGFARYHEAFPAAADVRVFDDALFLERCFGVLAHEMGHVLGMEHCVYYQCLMGGSNSLEESDAGPLHLCPVDLRKLGVAVKKAAAGDARGVLCRRYELLAAFFDSVPGFARDAAWVREHLAALGPATTDGGKRQKMPAREDKDGGEELAAAADDDAEWVDVEDGDDTHGDDDDDDEDTDDS